ncbi:hypothetical protein ACFE04_020938 [Oxalis oulophora]
MHNLKLVVNQVGGLLEKHHTTMVKLRAKGKHNLRRIGNFETKFYECSASTIIVPHGFNNDANTYDGCYTSRIVFDCPVKTTVEDKIDNYESEMEEIIESLGCDDNLVDVDLDTKSQGLSGDDPYDTQLSYNDKDQDDVVTEGFTHDLCPMMLKNMLRGSLI